MSARHRVLAAVRDPGSAIAGLIVVAGLVFGRLFGTTPALQQWAPSCGFRALFDVPCPTCGTTRILVMLAHFDVASAAAFAPLPLLLVVAAGGLGIWAALRQLGLVDPSPDDFLARAFERPAVVVPLVAAVVLLWGLSLLRMEHGHPL